ncbi:MAG: CvpA family protein [Thermomicrobiales bacterium]|nr:CvpA family protein [Thermomicrobiales bacterium]
MGALVLDFLLVIIFLMMIPIGFYRGGLRELCTAAGLMLGILMAQSWAADWARLYERVFGLGADPAHFLMGITIVVVITGFVGYGGSAAFAYRPGPGGRLYGAFLALFSAMVLAGFMINLYGETIVPTGRVEPVTSGIIARTLSEDFGVILLIATIGVAFSTIFGMFVRERSDEMPAFTAPSPNLYQPVDTRPYQTHEVAAPKEPVVIREVQEWKSEAEPPKVNPGTYGSGWRQTWPEATPNQTRNTRSTSRSTPQVPEEPDSPPPSGARDILADWMKDQGNS